MDEAPHLLERHAPKPAEKATKFAKTGDVAALRLCLERLIPPAKSKPVDMPELSGALADAGRTVLAALGEGRLNPDQAATLMQALGAQVRIIEVVRTAFFAFVFLVRHCSQSQRQFQLRLHFRTTGGLALVAVAIYGVGAVRCREIDVDLPRGEGVPAVARGKPAFDRLPGARLRCRAEVTGR